jgi:hypothetical protein
MTAAHHTFDPEGFAMFLTRSVLWASAVLLLAAASAAGQSRTNVFTVGPVPVDATAQSAAAARDQALADGERNALQMLMDRLTLATDRNSGRARLPRLTPAQLSDLVQGFDVADERRSGVRYLATYTFQFRPDAVRQLLQQEGIPYAETPSKPLVVLAVWREGGRVTLWDDPNPWRDAWAHAQLPPGLVPLTTPVGDIADVQAIDADGAVHGDDAKLQAVSAHYQGNDVLVTQATRRAGGSGLAITTTRYTPGTPDAAQSWTYDVAQQAAGTDLLATAVVDTVNRLDEAWKVANVLDPHQTGHLMVSVPAGTLADWVAVRDRLAGIPAVRGSHLLSLDRQGARLEITYIGDPAQLRLALAQRDLDLAGDDPNWVLRLHTAAAH